MHDVLRQILDTRTIMDGDNPIPLHSNMSVDEGRLIERVVREIRPRTSIEVGCAYGISTLFVCDAFVDNGHDGRHIVIDPFECTDWKGIGLSNLKRCGYDRFVEFFEERSEIVLPRLLSQGLRIQFAIIDGWHTFDQTLVEFYYINKMLEVGGVIILDDTHWPSVRRVVSHIMSYPAYEAFGVAGMSETPPRWRTALRRKLKEKTRMSIFERDWDYPTCTAVRKVCGDERNWDWHADF